jgi:queuosine precursor transporter
MSVGVIIWPIVFIISDVINEYYGRKGVQKISIIASLLIAYSFLIVVFSTQSPPADFWLENNAVDPEGNVLISISPIIPFLDKDWVLLGSITAFLVGQLVDAYTVSLPTNTYQS